MRGQLLLEQMLYIILYIFLIFSIYYLLLDYYKNFNKNLDVYESIKKFYTLEKKIDTLENSEYVEIYLNYPLLSNIKSENSMIIKEKESIFVFTTNN